MYNIKPKSKLQKLLLDKTYVANLLENSKELMANSPELAKEIWKELNNPFFFKKFLEVNLEQIYSFLDENKFLEKILVLDNNIGTNILTSAILALFDEFIFAFYPHKKDFIFKNKQKRLDFLNNKIVKFGTEKLIEFYNSIDLGHEEDAFRKTQILIGKIDQTLDLKTSENSSSFFTAILILSVLEPKLSVSENDDWQKIKKVFENILFSITLLKRGNFFTKRKMIKQQKHFFSVIQNFTYKNYLFELQSILFQNKYNFLHKDFLNYAQFRENTAIGYLKGNQDFRYQYLKKLTEILDNFKFYLQQQIAPPKPDVQKLKVNLSVEELCFLFKQLNSLKPEIFENKPETTLHRFISSSFITKKSDDLSQNSVKNTFYEEPEPKTVDFWKKHISTIQSNLKKY